MPHWGVYELGFRASFPLYFIPAVFADFNTQIIFNVIAIAIELLVTTIITIKVSSDSFTPIVLDYYFNSLLQLFICCHNW